MNLPRSMRALLWSFPVCVLAIAPVSAAPPRPVPGHYQSWDDGRIDDLQVQQSFHLKDYDEIEVLPPNVSAVAVPFDNTRDAVRRTLRQAGDFISDELDGSLPNRWKIKAEPFTSGLAAPPRSLVLRTKFVSMDPGSRAKRGLSFGNSGKSHVVLSGELLDAATNKPLLRFTLHNDDGGHGDYEHVLQENLEHAVDRLARLVKAFYP